MNELMQYTGNVDELKRTAELLALSNYFDAKGNTPQAVAQIATKIMAGRELGYGPFTSANGIHIIQGRPAVSANLMAAAVKASGRYDYRVLELSADVARIEFFQVGNGKRESLGVSTFTAADAKAAGTQNMAKFARNMLFARAMSNGVKWYCPDVFNGNAVYVPEELGATVDGDGEVIDVTPRVVTQVTTPEPTGNGTTGNGHDNPFDEPTPPPTQEAAAKDLRKFHAVGKQLYGDKWDAKRHEIINGATKGRTESSKDLTPSELAALTAMLDKRLTAANAEAAAATVQAGVEAAEALPF